MNNRILWVDVAKGIGIILVLLTHNGLGTVNKFVYMFHMPLFFFLSGFVFNPNQKFKTFMIKKIKSILIPYFTYAVVIVLFGYLKIYASQKLKISLGDTTFSVGNQIYRLLIQNRYLTLWFLATLLWLNIFSYFLLNKLKRKTCSILVIIFMVIGFVYYRLDGKAMFWDIDVVTTAMPFFYCGFLYKTNENIINNSINRFKPVINGLVYFAIGLIVGYIGYLITGKTLEMFGNCYACEPLTYISALLCINGIIELSKSINAKFLNYIGRNSIIYFALHQSVFTSAMHGVFKKIGIFQGELSFLMVIAQSLIISIVTILLLTVANELLKRNRVTRILFALK